MSRLIRDTDLINAIEEWISALVCTPAQYADCVVNGTLETVEEVIDKLPTAYDVEAVVRELERKSNGFFADDEEFGEMFVKTIPLPLAIEIVRGGRK